MAFAGLPIATLLGLLAAVGTATVVLYILKLRRRGVVVVFAPLWHQAAGVRQTSALFSQLKRWLSLLLQLVILGLLLLALADPRGTGAVKEGRNIVVLIDASASMKSVDVTPSRIDDAKREVRELVAGLSASDRMMIAQMDAAVTPVSAFSSDVAILYSAIDRVRATDTAANVAEALLFARDTLRGLQRPELIIISDGALGEIEAVQKQLKGQQYPVSLVPIGRERDNIAITEFSVRRYPLDKSRSEALLAVSNLGTAAVRVQLTLLGDGVRLDGQVFELGAGETAKRFYPDLASVDRQIEAGVASLDGRDWLAADNRAFALVPGRRRSKVAVLSTGNTYLEAALLLDEYLDVRLIDPKGNIPTEQFDVAILDGVPPPAELKANAHLYLNPPANGAVERARAISDFGFDTWDRNHLALRFVALENVQVTEGWALKPDAADKVIGKSEQGPILLAGTRDGHPFLALGFDPRNSDIVLRPAWPLLLLNAIDYFVKEDSQYLSSYRTGEAWRLTVPETLNLVEITEPRGVSTRFGVRGGELTFRGNDAGFYRIAALEPASQLSLELAANLADVEESRIAPHAELHGMHGPLARPQGFARAARQELWVYLLLFAFLLSAVEWGTYHKRVTV